MKKITFKELLGQNTELGRARRTQLTVHFEEMLRRARTADLAWMEADEKSVPERIEEKSKAKLIPFGPRKDA